MNDCRRPQAIFQPRWVWAMLLVLIFPVTLAAATISNAPVTVQKWTQFEKTFHSSIDYSEPFHDVTLTVTFLSPDGESTKISGFWDGGSTWRVRFSPDAIGTWTYKSS